MPKKRNIKGYPWFRKFDGKIFEYTRPFDSKEEAKEKAKEWRLKEKAKGGKPIPYRIVHTTLESTQGTKRKVWAYYMRITEKGKGISTESTDEHYKRYHGNILQKKLKEIQYKRNKNRFRTRDFFKKKQRKKIKPLP